MTGDLLKINGRAVPKLVSYKVSRAKLWKDADRNMSGDVRATLIGIFPKIQIQIGYTNKAQMRILTQLLDQDKFTVTWYDVRGDSETGDALCEADYYAGDYDVELDRKDPERYKPFTVSLIPISKRRY